MQEESHCVIMGPCDDALASGFHVTTSSIRYLVASSSSHLAPSGRSFCADKSFSQPKYVLDIPHEAGLTGSKFVAIPMEQNISLGLMNGPQLAVIL